MNKEILDEQLMSIENRDPEIKILKPGDIDIENTADHMISILQKMYVEHGITKNRESLISSLREEKVLTWFAKKGNDFVATASLIKNPDNSWELGRAVSLSRGNGTGKRVILEALKFHLDNHGNSPLTAEVRAANDFKGIPSGEATQRIFFGTLASILPVVPFAMVPLFSHGSPTRNEQFILSASDVSMGKTISEKVAEAVNNRSGEKVLPHLKIVQKSPFQMAVPSESGLTVSEMVESVETFTGCTLIPIEATDKNISLIKLLSDKFGMVISGVDRSVGAEGKPMIPIAALGRGANTLLAPTKISDAVPVNLQRDLREISEKFIR